MTGAVVAKGEGTEKPSLWMPVLALGCVTPQGLSKSLSHLHVVLTVIHDIHATRVMRCYSCVSVTNTLKK